MREVRLLEIEDTERLAELEEQKTRLFHRLSEIAEEQRRVASEVFAVEREQKALLKDAPEPIFEEPLTQEQVEEWAASRFFRYAKTAPGNPHAYTHRDWGDSEMFSRVVRYLREHGYKQRYGGADYVCLDLDLPGGRFYVWTMGAPVEETIILNRKPDGMRPDQPGGLGLDEEERRRKGLSG